MGHNNQSALLSDSFHPDMYSFLWATIFLCKKALERNTLNVESAAGGAFLSAH
jgi:hypothetical protein